MDKTKQKIAFSFLIAIFLAAFEGVVVSTAAPVIVKSLHNFKMISWIFSIFLLTSAISTPIYGKLADLYGRKRIFMIGISIFLFGSLLAGLSQTMHQLIIFRGIQGIGGGVGRHRRAHGRSLDRRWRRLVVAARAAGEQCATHRQQQPGG